MYSLVDRYQCFRWTCCLHLQSRRKPPRWRQHLELPEISYGNMTRSQHFGNLIAYYNQSGYLEIATWERSTSERCMKSSRMKCSQQRAIRKSAILITQKTVVWNNTCRFTRKYKRQFYLLPNIVWIGTDYLHRMNVMCIQIWGNKTKHNVCFIEGKLQSS